MADEDKKTEITPSPLAQPQVKPEPKVEPKVETQPRQEAKQEPKPQSSGVHDLGDDEDVDNIPEAIQKLALTPRALKGRITRAQKAQLREYFGTDDPEEARKELAELRKLKKEREEKDLAEMKEIERERKRRKDLEGELKRERGEREAERVEREVERTDGTLKEMAREHINPKYIKHAMRDFAEYIQGLDEAELKKLDKSPKLQAEWFKSYATEYPEHGISSHSKKDDKPKPKVKADVGAQDDDRPEPGKEEAPNFSSKGGKSTKDINEWMRSRGMSTRI